MAKNGNRGRRIKAGKKVQRRRRARERQLQASLSAADTRSGAAAGSGSAERGAAAAASTSNGGAEDTAFAVSRMVGGVVGQAAAPVVPAGSGSAWDAAVAGPPVSGAAAEGAPVFGLAVDGEEVAGAPIDSATGPLSSRLRRQRARSVAEAARALRGAATDASVEAALLPYDHAPPSVASNMSDGCTPREISVLRVIPAQVRARPGEGDVCVVCQEVFGGGDTLYELSCLHVLHAGCTHGWLLRHNRCPVCSRSVVVSV